MLVVFKVFTNIPGKLSGKFDHYIVFILYLSGERHGKETPSPYLLSLLHLSIIQHQIYFVYWIKYMQFGVLLSKSTNSSIVNTLSNIRFTFSSCIVDESRFTIAKPIAAAATPFLWQFAYPVSTQLLYALSLDPSIFYQIPNEVIFYQHFLQGV